MKPFIYFSVRRVVLSGVISGIGASIALLLSRHNANLAVTIQFLR